LDDVVAVLADEPITDGRIEEHIGPGAAKEPSGDDVANAVSFSAILAEAIARFTSSNRFDKAELTP
jgi:hypothetical protein